jgi:hypothetical protein
MDAGRWLPYTMLTLSDATITDFIENKTGDHPPLCWWEPEFVATVSLLVKNAG